MSAKEIFKQYNKHGEKGLLQKALTSAVGSGDALIREWWEDQITNLIIHLQPEFAMIDALSIESKTYNYRRLITQGTGGGAMGESAVTPIVDDVWAEVDLAMKIIRRRLQVTGFMQASARQDYDAMALQIEQGVRGHVQQMMYYIHRGNANFGDALEHDGLDKMIKTNRFNSFSGGLPTIPTNLDFVDNLIDAGNIEGATAHRKMLIMSPQMLSRISTLLTNVRNEQSRGMITQIDIEGGWRLNAYRNVPIIESTFVGSSKSGTMGTIIGAGSDPGDGGLSDDTFFAIVTFVGLRGESIASAKVSTAISAGTGTQIVTYTFTEEPDALSYKLYVGLTTGLANLTLNNQVSANTYDAAGTITGRTTTIVLTSTTPDPLVIPAELQADLPPSAVNSGAGLTNAEEVILWNVDPVQGLGRYPYVHEQGNRVDGLVSIEPLSKNDDANTMLLKSYVALAEKFEATSSRHRGLLPR